MPKPKNAGSVRLGRTRPFRYRLRVGDRVRILDIPDDLKNPEYDKKNAEHRQMRTAELFRFCVGRVFKVYDFDRYGNVEMFVSNSSVVRKKFGKWHTIWCEPKFLRRLAPASKKL